MDTPNTGSNVRPPNKFLTLPRWLCVTLDWLIARKTKDAAQEAALFETIEQTESQSSLGLNHQTFTKYVKHKDDLVGFVAYSIYKQHKISFLAREYQKTLARAGQEKVDAFCDSYSNPEQVELLRERAANLIEAMNELLLDEAIKKVRAEEKAAYEKKLKDGPGWTDSILKSVAGNIVTAAFVALIVFGASAGSNGFWDTLGNWSGKTITDKNSATDSQEALKDQSPKTAAQ